MFFLWKGTYSLYFIKSWFLQHTLKRSGCYDSRISLSVILQCTISQPPCFPAVITETSSTISAIDTWLGCHLGWSDSLSRTITDVANFYLHLAAFQPICQTQASTENLYKLARISSDAENPVKSISLGKTPHWWFTKSWNWLATDQPIRS